MVQSTSWEANQFAASQEIPRNSRNPKVHYRTHKLPPPVSILGQPNPVHIPTSHLLEIHPNIIHPSTPKSPKWSLSLRLPHQDHIHNNKFITYCKTKILCIRLVNYWDKYTEMHGQKTSKFVKRIFAQGKAHHLQRVKIFLLQDLGFSQQSDWAFRLLGCLAVSGWVTRDI